MPRRSFTFRWHLAAFGILVVVPIILAAAAISALYVASERASLERQTLAAARDVAASVDRHFEGAIASLRTLALSRALADGDFDGFYQQAVQIKGIIEAGVIGLRTPGGVQMVNTAIALGVPQRGAVDPILLRADRQALAERRSVVSDVYRGAVTGQPFVAVVQPVDVQGVEYVLSLAIPPENIRRTIAAGRTVPEDWLVVVTDRNHRVVARSRDHDRMVGVTASEEFSRQLRDPEGSFTSTTLDGVDVFDAYTRSAISGFVVTAAVPESWLAAPLQRALLVTALIAGLGVVCSLLLAFAYGRQLLPPIGVLRNSTLRLARRRAIEPVRVGIAELDAVSDAIASASSDLERQDRAERILINELNHRVKNSLTVVQSIAQQTLARAASTEGFRADFSGRLVAFAKAHDALSETGWVSADLRDLAQRVCGPVAGEGRLTLDGPPVDLPARIVLTLGLVLHELATNAVKYGALTTAAGRIAVRWDVRETRDQRSVHLRWSEQGGPMLAPPTRQGFGTRLILASIREDLRGTAELEFPSGGARLTAVIPLATPSAQFDPERIGSADDPAMPRDRGGKVEQRLVAASPSDE